ncbi:MAG: hypothetical protein KA717_15095 [Woronichinia naegeliana WA131]|jgi:predicted RNase H-like HicB family nuclease|uniref:Type II toxin-antitoxin system HicB family antitoxin n=1 Tax=Woronichinia naegeliana WA131 TaxID=2824559 RepID=A0A977L1N1_9CYAN|nr:MAG: hypothetical protein KA717_15095 [Woronichinia naegeliana WA131]
MQQLKQLTCIIKREGDDYGSLCPQMDIASQGESVEEARNNLIFLGFNSDRPLT